MHTKDFFQNSYDIWVFLASYRFCLCTAYDVAHYGKSVCTANTGGVYMTSLQLLPKKMGSVIVSAAKPHQKWRRAAQPTNRF